MTMSVRDACPECGSQLFKKNGHIHNGKQNHQCQACGRQFVLDATNRVIDEEHRTVRVLLVENNPAGVRRLQERLDKVAIPLTLHAVDCGEGALALLRHQSESAQAPRLDVLFLDLDLPKLDWFPLLAEIAKDPRLKDLPVVVFNGAECQIDHLVATGLVAAHLTHSLGRAQYVKLLAKLQRERGERPERW